MITIHKYKLFFGVGVEMPKDAKILSLQIQDGYICIWAMVDTDKPVERRRFTRYGTGHEIIASDVRFLKFIETIQDGPLVWHIFEVKE